MKGGIIIWNSVKYTKLRTYIAVITSSSRPTQTKKGMEIKQSTFTLHNKIYQANLKTSHSLILTIKDYVLQNLII